MTVSIIKNRDVFKMHWQLVAWTIENVPVKMCLPQNYITMWYVLYVN